MPDPTHDTEYPTEGDLILPEWRTPGSRGQDFSSGPGAIDVRGLDREQKQRAANEISAIANGMRSRANEMLDQVGWTTWIWDRQYAGALTSGAGALRDMANNLTTTANNLARDPPQLDHRTLSPLSTPLSDRKYSLAHREPIAQIAVRVDALARAMIDCQERAWGAELVGGRAGARVAGYYVTWYACAAQISAWVRAIPPRT